MFPRVYVHTYVQMHGTLFMRCWKHDIMLLCKDGEHTAFVEERDGTRWLGLIIV